MDTMALVMSTVALLLYSASYFFNTKRGYLILQLTGNFFLATSYCLIGAYFTTVSVVIGIARALICYGYEKRNKSVPLFVIFGLCAATATSYIVINHLILSESSMWDVLYLIASFVYTVSFAIRNIRVMRYVVLIPHSCAVTYNLLISAPISSAISYGIELVVTLAAIVKYDVLGRRTGAKRAKHES